DIATYSSAPRLETLGVMGAGSAQAEALKPIDQLHGAHVVEPSEFDGLTQRPRAVACKPDEVKHTGQFPVRLGMKVLVAHEQELRGDVAVLMPDPIKPQQCVKAPALRMDIGAEITEIETKDHSALFPVNEMTIQRNQRIPHIASQQDNSLGS